MTGHNELRSVTQLRTFGASEICFTKQRINSISIAYWLLLTFVILLYSNLAVIKPALETVHPAKLVAGAALVMLLMEMVFARKGFDVAWPEGFLLLAFLGAAALSTLTALWARGAAEAVLDLLKFTIIYFFIVNCLTTERRMRGLMWTMIVGGLFPWSCWCPSPRFWWRAASFCRAWRSLEFRSYSLPPPLLPSRAAD